MKRRIVKKIIFCVFIIIVAIGVGFFVNHKSKKVKLEACQEYVVGNSGIKGNVDKAKFEKKSTEFKIGANKYGYAVFKNPKKAMKVFKEKYSVGISAIRKEFDLEELTDDNVEQYKECGTQLTKSTKKQKRQAAFVSEFLDIYENSFKKD